MIWLIGELDINLELQWMLINYLINKCSYNHWKILQILTLIKYSKPNFLNSNKKYRTKTRTIRKIEGRKRKSKEQNLWD